MASLHLRFTTCGELQRGCAAHPASSSAHRSWQQQRPAFQSAPQPPRASRRRGPACPPAAPSVASEPAAAAAISTSAGAPAVVLTREAGKNGVLQKVLAAAGVACLEMPLVETAAGPDRPALVEILSGDPMGAFDWVALTSPEAAKVFMQAWRAAGRPAVRIAVVGDGTGKVLTAAEGDVLRPAFVASVANAEHFGPELPLVPGGTNAVLYPSSSKASTELQTGLIKRGFSVTRLNTYDTLPVGSIDGATLAAAMAAPVLTIASPSAIKAFVKLCGGEVDAGRCVACIGSTSARAAEKLGFTNVVYPDAPGVEAWAEVILAALE